MISFVIPAHDEERSIGATLAAIHGAAAGRAYEIVVVADSCTDRTREISLEHGARVVPVAVRQIAAARNAGAAAARGELLVFVDADTRVARQLVDAVVDAVGLGAVGGGALVRFDRPQPWWAGVVVPALTALYFSLRLAAGCFVFATREAFQAVGGFDEELYAGEEVELSRALKRFARAAGRVRGRRARFVVLQTRVETSARKLRTHSGLELLRLTVRLLFGGRRAVRSRERLALWYGERPHDPGSSHVGDGG